jgi:hypothetical protein
MFYLRGLFYKTLRNRNLRKTDKFYCKLVSFHKYTNLYERTMQTVDYELEMFYCTDNCFISQQKNLKNPTIVDLFTG